MEKIDFFKLKINKVLSKNDTNFVAIIDDNKVIKIFNSEYLKIVGTYILNKLLLSESIKNENIIKPDGIIYSTDGNFIGFQTNFVKRK